MESLFVSHHWDILSQDTAGVNYAVGVDTKKQFASWFNTQLRRRGWSQSDFHREAGLPRQSVSTWANGRSLPDPESCDQIAEAFGLDLDMVLAVAGHRPVISELPVDDPRRMLIGLIETTRLEPHMVDTLETLLTGWHQTLRRGKS